MTIIETAHRALSTLHERLLHLEDRFIALAAAALGFDVAAVTELTEDIVAAEDVVASAYAAAADSLVAVRDNDLDATPLNDVRHGVRELALRVQEVQADTRVIVERARTFTSAHARALVGAPAAAVGYTRRGYGAVAPSMSGALQLARV